MFLSNFLDKNVFIIVCSSLGVCTMAINSVSSFQPQVNFKQQPQKTGQPVSQTVINQPQEDVFISENKPTPPHIGTGRLMTGFLTDKQVEEINQTRKLPPNAKFVQNGIGGYAISNNFFGVRIGTQTLPEGFEVKKNIIGQAVVLPKDSDGLFIK